MPTDLRALEDFGRRLVSDPAECLTYEADAGFDRAVPDAVFYPESAEDVQRIVRWAAEQNVPVVARGAGTGLAGGAVAERGGVVVVPARMDRVEIDADGRAALVEAGAVNLEVEAAAGRAGLTYPPDPSSGRSCQIGGNLGTNAGGPHCFKYGVTTNFVTGVEAVLADGRLVRLGGRAADPPEVDLTALVVGSEGTLAVVTRAWLRLLRRPPGVRTLMASFESLERAGEAVSAVIAAGLVPATLEAIDQRGMKVIEAYRASGLPADAGAVLIAEVDGYEAGLEAQQTELAAVLERHGGYDLRVARSEEERQRIWYGRKSAAGAMARVAPSYYLTDLTVRRSRLAAVLGEVHAICDRYRLETASFFHAGDGNLHPLIPYDPRDRDWTDRAHRAIEEITALAAAEDGSITGEHGVGMEKRRYMPLMCSGAELAAMRDVKLAFDPQELLNPGKVLPAELPPATRAEPVEPGGDVCEPATAEEAAGLLRALSDAGRTARIGGRRRGADVAISTAKLSGVSTFAPEDLYLTAGAGTPVAELEAFLEPHGLLAPVRAPWPETTVGGLVAANLNAPLRLRYGGLRDLVLCATVALADGRRLRAGRPLVKNVAGYDLAKAFVGSFGTLGLLTDVTLKLTAAPRARRTLALGVDGLAAGLELADRARARALVASAVVLEADGNGRGGTLLYTAEGRAEDVDAELEAVAAAWYLEPEEARRSGTDAWAAFLRAADEESLLVRLGVPVKDLAPCLTALPEHPGARWLVDAAAGLAYGVWQPDDAGAARAWLEALRRPALELGGYAVAQAVPARLAGEIDRWGFRPEALDVMRRLKERWDPAGILEPGTFVVG